MRTVLSKIVFLCFLASCFMQVTAQEGILSGYVKHGLDSNLVVAQKALSLKKALNGLAVARSLYLPNVSFDMLYSTASGGRAIDLPVGDMLNPVYTTLNQLTGGSSFPLIENQQINFLPKNYYDAKLRTSVPIVNTDIKYNRAIKQQLGEISKQELEIYARELVKDIKVAYYNYWSATDAVDIYKNALSLAVESKRVNEKLLEAGKGLPAYVIRSNAEVAQCEAKITEAEQQQKNALYYFNALLNRAPTDEILMDKAMPLTQGRENGSVEGREELRALETNIAIQENIVQMNKLVYVPRLSAFFDLGSQAEGMRVNKNSGYYMLGAQLSFPIFSGNKNKLKVQESQIALTEAQNQLEQAKQQLALGVAVAAHEVVATRQNYSSSKVQLEAAATYQRLIQRGFSEGVNTYIETIDARSQYTQAQLAHNIASYKFLTAVAKYERETASYPL